MFRTSGPGSQVSKLGQLTNDVGVRCFLKYDEVRINRTNHFGNRLFASASTETDVVTEQLNGQSNSVGEGGSGEWTIQGDNRQRRQRKSKSVAYALPLPLLDL